MIQLAIRNLVTERTRFAFSAAGIGFAVFLITVMISLYQGWSVKIGGFVEEVDGDAWVAREGTTDFINAASILPLDLGESVRGGSRVTGAYPLIDRFMAFTHGSGTVEVQLIGYDVDSGVGGPPKIVKGRGEPRGNQIVLDEVASREFGVGIGDVISNGGTDVEVIGLSSGGNFAVTQAAFMEHDAAAALVKTDGLTTFFVVRLADPEGFAAWRADLAAANPGITAFTSDEFAEATRRRILDSVLPILLMIIGLAFIVGIAITSLTIYTATVERTREFGVMKAVGFNNLDLFRLVAVQSLIIGLFGFVFGAALTIVLSTFADRLVATFILHVRPQDLALVLSVTLVMAILSAIVPARRVGGIDPAVVFRG